MSNPIGPIVGRQALAAMFGQAGLDTVFTVAGGHFLPTYHELGVAEPVRIVAARHEQGAGYMASGHALITGRPGVVFSGAPGPGATNLVTPVANAFADSIPLLVITAQVDHRYIHRNILQYCDNTALFAPFSKWSVEAVSLAEVPNLLANALQLAVDGRPGPVHVAIPQNVQAEMIEAWPHVTPAAPSPRLPTSNDVAAMAERIDACERPVVLAGHGVVRSRGSEALQRFAEQIGAPVATSRSGVGAIRTDHPHSVGMLGFYGTDAARDALAEADLVFIAGCAMGEQTTFGWRSNLIADGAAVMQVDIEPSQINRIYPTDLGVVADAGAAVASLADHCAPRSPWFGARRSSTAAQNDPAQGMSAADIMGSINRSTSGNAVVTADIGNHRLWVCDQLDVTRTDGLLQSCEFDAMGFSLPAAIGAAVAEPETPVVAIAGDGGFVHTMGELVVAKDLGAKVMAVVFVDGALGILKHQAEEMYGGHHHVELGPIDFAAVAMAMGVPARSVDDPAELDEAMQWALGLDGPSLLAVAIDPDEVFPPLRTKIEQRKRDLLGVQD